MRMRAATFALASQAAVVVSPAPQVHRFSRVPTVACAFLFGNLQTGIFTLDSRVAEDYS
jgi:hypothetical protein